MKRFTLLLAIGLWLVFSGCKSTDSLATAGEEGQEQSRPAMSPNVVSGDEIRDRPVQNFQELIRGRVAGVRVYEVAGGLKIEIRGSGGSNFRGDDIPLYLIDGLPIHVGSSGVLTGINPYDIKEIRIHKGADALALFGPRASNGAVEIITRQAKDMY